MSIDVKATTSKTAGKYHWFSDEASRDVVVFCPGCKTMETLSLTSERMAPTGRFVQRADAVYHACGSNIPCRLYSPR